MGTKIVENIRKMREKKGVSQEKMASLLGVSRATYISIESGRRDITSNELEAIKTSLGISWADIVEPISEYDERNDQKFEQMYMYILRRFFRNYGIPKTKLAKLLYLADFTSFYERQEAISGVTYIRRDYGPVADIFFILTDRLYDEAKIGIKPLDSAQMIIPTLTSRENFNLLTDSDKQILDRVCKVWQNKRTQEIVDFTHSQKPWKECREREEIPYSLIIQEDPEHVYAPYTC